MYIRESYPVRMRVTRIDPENWLHTDNLPLRADILHRRYHQVFRCLPCAYGAMSQSMNLINKYIPLPLNCRFSDLAKYISEDVCIMQKINGEWVMTAGLVCFPNMWSLEEKLGLPLDKIHGDVPGFNSISYIVSKYFDRMKPGIFMQRHNWGLSSSPEMYLPYCADRPNDIEKTYLRTEQQVLTKLDKDTVVFTIYTRVIPYSQLHPTTKQKLQELIHNSPAEVLRYKGLSEIQCDSNSIRSKM